LHFNLIPLTVARPRNVIDNGRLQAGDGVMAIEIERKFLVRGSEWQQLATGHARIHQAYLPTEAGLSLRVRLRSDSDATLTVKSRGTALRRLEFEYPIPAADAEALMRLRRGSVVEKVRHAVPWHSLTWEVDEFAGENAGLIIAEIELPHEDQSFALPDWLGPEITGQDRYYNHCLAEHPFSRWEGQPVLERTARS
jgi:adenylate cyclase